MKQFERSATIDLHRLSVVAKLAGIERRVWSLYARVFGTVNPESAGGPDLEPIVSSESLRDLGPDGNEEAPRAYGAESSTPAPAEDPLAFWRPRLEPLPPARGLTDEEIHGPRWRPERYPDVF